MLKSAVTAGRTADVGVATATANRLGPRVHAAASRAAPDDANDVDVAGADGKVDGGDERDWLLPDRNAPRTVASASAAAPISATRLISRRLRPGLGARRRFIHLGVGGVDAGDGAAGSDAEAGGDAGEGAGTDAATGRGAIGGGARRGAPEPSRTTLVAGALELDTMHSGGIPSCATRLRA